MGIKVGDEIKYLNDVGGGKVIALRDNKIAVVLQDDGFEVPVLINECVKVEMPTVKAPQPVQPKTVVPEKQVYDYTEINSPEGDQLNILLAFVPTDSKSLEIDDVDLYLVNDSNYFMQYLFGKNKPKNALLLDHGVVEPNTKVLLDGFEKRRLLEFRELWVSGQFFKLEKPFEKKPTIEFELTLTAEKLERKAFKENDFFEEDARIFHLVENDLYKSLRKLSDEDIEAAKKEKQTQRPRIVRVELPKDQIIEVDLHINALIDNLTGLSNADILNHQMSRFRETLEENKTSKGQKIVFIHGVGNGTLKTELRNELDRKKIRHQDASFKEYGFGATMVII